MAIRLLKELEFSALTGHSKLINVVFYNDL